jgi:hypothetical protein
MNAPLCKLASKITVWNFISDEYDDLRHKQHFPYSYFTETDSKTIFQILNEKELPQDPMEWDNFLKPRVDATFENEEENIKGIKELTEIVSEATVAFKKHGCANLKDEVLLYLKVDILLLAEVLFSFRSNNIKTWKIDPCCFVSLPGCIFLIFKN